MSLIAHAAAQWQREKNVVVLLGLFLITGPMARERNN